MNPKIVFLVTFLIGCFTLNVATEEVNKSSLKETEDVLGSENVPVSKPDFKERMEGWGRQLKWLQPATYILSNLKKKNPDEKIDDSGRFFKIIQKGSSVNPSDMLAQILKKALEDFNGDFKDFRTIFSTFVRNELQRVTLEPDFAAQFINQLNIFNQETSNNIERVGKGLLQTLLEAVKNLLGIDLVVTGTNLDQILGGLFVPTGK